MFTEWGRPSSLLLSKFPKKQTKSTYSFALIYLGSNCMGDSSGKSEAGVPMASHGQETLKGMGMMALKSIKLRETLNLEILLSVFGRGRWGYALNTVMVRKRHCTTTAAVAPVYNMKLWFLLIPSTGRHLPWGDVAGSEAQAGRGFSLSWVRYPSWLRDESLH